MTNLLIFARTLASIALCGTALLLSGCHPSGASASGDGMKATTRPSTYAVIANGKVDIEGGVIEIAARRAGVTSEVLANEGDTVKKGQVLARQEDRDLVLAAASAHAAVAEAQSQLQLTQVTIRTAEREFERLKNLAVSHLVSQQAVDQAADALATARAQLVVQQAAVDSAKARAAQADYNEDLTIVRAPVDGKIVRRYANPGAGASTLNVSNMFDLEPAIPHIVRAEIVESAIPLISVGQQAEIVSEADPSKVTVGAVLRIAATFGARKLKSDSASEAADERVVEVVVSAGGAPYLIGQRVLVKFMKPGEQATASPVALPAKAPTGASTP